MIWLLSFQSNLADDTAAFRFAAHCLAAADQTGQNLLDVTMNSR